MCVDGESGTRTIYSRIVKKVIANEGQRTQPPKRLSNSNNTGENGPRVYEANKKASMYS